MPQFKKYKLSDLAEITSSKRIFYNEYVSQGIPFYRSKEIIERFNGNKQTESLYIKKDKFEEIKSKFGVPSENDLLLTSVGTLGIPYLVKKTDQFYFKDGNLTWFRKWRDIVNPKFIYYWIQSPIGKETLDNNKIGSTQEALTIVALKSIEINLPSLPTQTRIAAILSSLDDKIELNRRTNATLEAMAQTLFKKYFVDDIDPDNLPDGWRWGKVGEFINSISITHKFPKDEVIFLNTGDIYDGKILHNNYSDVSTLPGQAKKTIKRNDILFSEIRPANKRYAFVNFEADNFVVSTKLMVLRSISFIDSIFFYFILTSNESLSYLQNLAEARSGTFPQITFDQVKEIDFLLPSKDVLNNFIERTLKPTYSIIFNNEKEIETLAKIRDSLLPKLMSGEIEVNAAENELVS